MSKKHTVAIVGASGKMGQLVDFVVSNLTNYSVVAQIGSSDNLTEILKDRKPDIAVDVTSHASVLANSRVIIENGVRPIIGTSGLTQSNIDELTRLCDIQKLGGVIIPNFSIGVALMTKFVLMCKPYFADFSLLELHHKNKKDRPSGTGRHIANLLGIEEGEIASIRADGFLSKQQVYINSEYERVLVDHESFDRKSFIPGIELSLNKVLELNQLIIGLENIV